MKYGREFLLSFSDTGARTLSLSALDSLPGAFQRQSRPRKRGRRGGVKRRLKLRRYNPPLPSILFGNAQSMRNKRDEILANFLHLSEYKYASVICFTETWMKKGEPDPEIPGFSIIRGDRTSEETGKSCGGGVCMYINNLWCNNFTVIEQFCAEDVEVLCVGLRPFYLPREFPRVFITVVYIHPAANTKTASFRISRVAQRLSNLCPEAPRFFLGDFNQCRLYRVMPNFRQYVKCKTHGKNTIDLCYGSVPGAFRARPIKGVGKSKHNMIQLLPLYRQRYKREKPVVRHVKVWTQESVEALRGSFDCTDWDMLINSSASLDEAAEVITDYINFCTDNVVEQKQVKTFSNNKPWVGAPLRSLILSKQTAFKEADEDKVKEIQQKIDKTIFEEKVRFKDKVEENFLSRNSRECWKGV